MFYFLYLDVYYIFFNFTVAHSKIEKNKISVQIKKIEHGIANKCTQETEVSV